MCKTRICSMCGREHRRTAPLCQACYTQLRRHPDSPYQLPNKGEVCYAKNGDVICHICGQAFPKLGNHIYHTHNMTQNEYRDMYGLQRNERLTSKKYQKVMREYTDTYYDLVVADNLVNKGESTRFTEGQYVERRGKHKIRKERYL